MASITYQLRTELNKSLQIRASTFVLIKCGQVLSSVTSFKANPTSWYQYYYETAHLQASDAMNRKYDERMTAFRMQGIVITLII
jgi:hypothetical protein